MELTNRVMKKRFSPPYSFLFNNRVNSLGAIDLVTEILIVLPKKVRKVEILFGSVLLLTFGEPRRRWQLKQADENILLHRLVLMIFGGDKSQVHVLYTSSSAQKFFSFFRLPGSSLKQNNFPRPNNKPSLCIAQLV